MGHPSRVVGVPCRPMACYRTLVTSRAGLLVFLNHFRCGKRAVRVVGRRERTLQLRSETFKGFFGLRLFHGFLRFLRTVLVLRNIDYSDKCRCPGCGGRIVICSYEHTVTLVHTKRSFSIHDSLSCIRNAYFVYMTVFAGCYIGDSKLRYEARLAL